MNSKMLRFLTSIGIEEPEKFDLSFILAARNPYNRDQVDMAVQKLTPWNYPLLDELVQAMGNIRYPYTMRFSYECEIGAEDVASLYYDWYFCRFQTIPSVPLNPGKNDCLVLTYASEEDKKANFHALEDFRSLLRFINYPFAILESVEVPVVEIKEEPIIEKEPDPVEKEPERVEKIVPEEANIEPEETSSPEPEQEVEEKKEPTLTEEQQELEDMLNLDSIPSFAEGASAEEDETLPIAESEEDSGIEIRYEQAEPLPAATPKPEIEDEPESEPETAFVSEEKLESEPGPLPAEETVVAAEIEPEQVADEPQTEVAAEPEPVIVESEPVAAEVESNSEDCEDDDDNSYEEPEERDLSDEEPEPAPAMSDEDLEYYAMDAVSREAEGAQIRQAGESVLIKEHQENNRLRREAENRERVWSRGNYAPIHRIDDLFQAPLSNVEFEGELFQSNYKLGRSGKASNMFAIGDETNAISVKAFESRLLTRDVLQNLKDGQRYRVRGALDNDKFTHSRCVMVHYLEKLPTKVFRTDDEPVKRAEFHLHTNMSTMDGIQPFKDFYEAARKMGFTAIGLCDHGAVQSFPFAQYAREDHIGKIKKDGLDEKPLKILYGCEFYMFDPELTHIINPAPVPLKHAKYCVFDTETTGLSRRHDRLLEFGGVIVEDGHVTKEWGTLINPEMKDLSEAAGALAINKITESELLNAPTLDVVLPQIMEFLGDCVLVAHNAPFDIGFLNEALAARGMPIIKNPVIDTVTLSRYMFPTSARHSEGSLLKNLGLRNYEEDSAHRAVYDAHALSEGWTEMLFRLENAHPGIKHEDLASLSVQKPSDLPKGDENNPDDPTYKAWLAVDETYKKYCKGFHPYHVTAYAKNKAGISTLFEVLTESQTTYLARVPRTPKELLASHRENLLIGSACFNGEIFEIASTRSKEDLVAAMAFYDFIELQPLENYSYLIHMGRVANKERLIQILSDIVEAAKIAGKKIVATGDAHYVDPTDKIYRDIFIATKGIGNGSHDMYPPARSRLPQFENPDQHLRTTREMLDSFEQWLPKEEAYEYVVTNSNYFADQIEDNIVIVDSKTYTPNANLPNSEKILRDLCESNFHKNYDYLGDDNDPEVLEAIEKTWQRLQRELSGIIGSGYAVTYYIAHRLIKLANNEPEHFIVGSRGSVGSSFAATMAEITEVNALPAHYHCPHCHYLKYEDSTVYRSGFDLPDKVCPKCGTKLEANGQNIPFETFLGFHADKVPDIDLNFEEESQHRAHNYCRDLLGANNVFRAGTIETVADKTAFGYVRGYFEKIGRDLTKISSLYIAYLASHCTGVKRTTGQHPGGIVVIPADHSVYDFTAVQYPADDVEAGWLTTHFDFHALHDEVLKLDILGHVDPMAMRYYRDLTGVSIESIPMNDPKVLSIFSSPKELKMHRNYLGVENGATALPEFGTQLGMQMLSAIHPKCFNDLIIIAGLAHGTNVWAGNAEELVKQGKSINEIIGCRDEIMTYLISMGLESAKAFNIMERVRKGRKLTPDLEADMRAHNVPDFYIDSCNKIAYLFPRGHATAYVTMAVRVAYFKLYYPLEFYAVFFSVRSDDWDIRTMIAGEDAVIARIEEWKPRLHDNANPLSPKEKNQYKTLLVALEMLERGYTFANIDLYRSDAKMFVCDHENKCLIPPFIVVESLGENVARSICEAREEVDAFTGEKHKFISKENLRDRTRLSGTLINKLEELGVLDGLGESNQGSLFDFL